MFGISNSAVHNTLAIAEYLISYVNDRHSQVNLFESLVHESVLNHNPLRHRRAQTKISHSAIHFQDFHGKMSSAQIFIKWTTISSTSPSLLNVTRYHKLSTKNLSDVHNLFPLKITLHTDHWADPTHPPPPVGSSRSTHWPSFSNYSNILGHHFSFKFAQKIHFWHNACNLQENIKLSTIEQYHDHRPKQRNDNHNRTRTRVLNLSRKEERCAYSLPDGNYVRF